MRTIPFDEAVKLIQDAPVFMFAGEYFSKTVGNMFEDDNEDGDVLMEEVNDTSGELFTLRFSPSANAEIPVSGNRLTMIDSNNNEIFVYIYHDAIL